MASPTSSSVDPSPYISAVSTSVRPRSRPSRTAAKSSRRRAGSMPRPQVPWPSAGTVSPEGRAMRRIGRLLPVADDPHLLERDEAAADHAVEDRQEGVDPFLAVDDLDDQRKVLGQAQDLRRVQPARLAVADRPAQ